MQIVAVTASGDDGNKPTNVLDGNMNTRWSCKGKGSWIQFDLGTTWQVSEVDVAWYKGNIRSNNFDIGISDDGITIKPVSTGVSTGKTLSAEKYAVNLEGRYVRITVNGNSSSKDSEWASITDVSLFGVGHAPVPPPPGPPPGVRRQVRDTVTRGDPVADEYWSILSDTGPIEGPPPTPDSLTVLDLNFSTVDAGTSISGIYLQSVDTIEGAKITYAVKTQPSNGTLTGEWYSGLTYTANAGFTGTDNFTYDAVDSEGQVSVNTATVSITVGAPAPPPPTPTPPPPPIPPPVPPSPPPTPPPVADNVDKFGIKKIYDDGPGPVSYMDMDDPTKTRGAGLGQNPEGNQAYYPKFVKNPDGSWKNTNGLEVRWAWCSSDVYPGDNAICKCYDTNNRSGNMGSADDWPARVEMTAYYMGDSPGTGTRNGECHVEHVISGHRSTTSSTGSGPGDCQLGCAGSYHCNKYPLTGREKFEKDYHHSFAYAQDLNGVNNNSATAKWGGDGKWHGFKDIFYVRADGTTVQLEQWADWDCNNNWKKTHSYVDQGQWTPKASYSGCGSGPQNIVFCFNGPLVVFRADNWNSYSMKNLSVRSIDPTKPLMAPEEHAKEFPPDDFVEPNDVIHQEERWRTAEVEETVEKKDQ